ncbi:MAG: GTP cyclohydrolase I, partial [Acidobacteriales bacterium]|nr:GTP cyclohydrolase I [Terriglobales bacterium]
MNKRTAEPVSLTGASMSELLREFLVRLGEDPERDGLQRTPERMERAFQFLTKGYKEDPEKMLRGALFDVT